MSALEAPAVLISHAFARVVFAASARMGDTFGSIVVSQADSLAQTAEAGADETRRAVTFLVLCLIAIAVGLAALTAWYWQYTSPHRQAKMLLNELGHYNPSGHQVTEGLDQVPSAVPDEVPSAVPNRVPDGAQNRVPDRVSSRAPNHSASPGGPPLAGSSAVARPFAVAAPVKPVKLVPAVSSGSERIEFAERQAAAGRKVPGRPVKAPAGALPPSKPATASETPAIPAIPAMPKAKPATVSYLASSGSPITVPVPPVSRPPATAVADPAVLSGSGRPDPGPDGGESHGQEGLSDDDWAAVMQSAFKHLNR